MIPYATERFGVVADWLKVRPDESDRTLASFAWGEGNDDRRHSRFELGSIASPNRGEIVTFANRRSDRCGVGG